MKLELFQYSNKKNWLPALQPEMDSEQTLVLVFGAPAFGHTTDVFTELHKAFPKSKLIGCSTAGEIFGAEIFDNTLSVAVMQFANTTLKQTHVSLQETQKSFDAGRQIADTLNATDLKSIFIISDGLAVNGSELIRGVNSILSESVVVTGGLAGDGDRFENTWVIKDYEPAEDIISAIGFYGDAIQVHHGSKGGWDNFGPKRLVTKSKDNILYELDNKPALALYKEYLGQRASGLPSTALLFPLALIDNEEDQEYTVRTVLSIDEDKQSMTFAGDIPEGAKVQLMRADFERLIDGAIDAATMAANNTDINGDVLNIAISCIGRRLVLGERSEDEVEATLESLPAGTKQIGFYSYGEISPCVDGQACQLHNQTMTLTTITEKI